MQQTAAYKQRGGDQRHGQLERDIAQKLGQICARMMLYAQVGFALQPRAQKIGQQRGNFQRFVRAFVHRAAILHKLRTPVNLMQHLIAQARRYHTHYVDLRAQVGHNAFDGGQAARQHGQAAGHRNAVGLHHSGQVFKYLRQIMEDGFFHADPHPGNLRVRDGKIVWLDMGMMGSLDERQRTLIGKAVTGVARGDINLCRDAVMGLGEFHGKTDKRRLYRDIEDLLDKYGSADLGTMDLAEVFEDMTSVMKTNGIAMPSSLTMLARGLATIEGVVADLSPELNIMNVITARIGDQMFDNVDWRALLTQDARAIYESSRKSLEIPALLADILRTGLKGEANLGVEHHAGEDVRKLVIAMVRKLCLMLLSLGLLIFGGAVAGNGPQVFGLSIYSSGCFVLALCAAGFALWNKKK